MLVFNFQSAFPRFRQLNADIRLKIWQLALQPQELKFYVSGDRHHPHDHLHRRRTTIPCQQIFSFRCQIPPLLHVCHESREIALGYYVLGFKMSQTWDVGTILQSRPPCAHRRGDLVICNEPVYWNPSRDIVTIQAVPEDPQIHCHPDAWCQQYTRTGFMTLDERVRCVVVLDFPDPDCWWYRKFDAYLPGLEAVFVIIDPKIFPLFYAEFDENWESRQPWNSKLTRREAIAKALDMLLGMTKNWGIIPKGWAGLKVKYLASLPDVFDEVAVLSDASGTPRRSKSP